MSQSEKQNKQILSPAWCQVTFTIAFFITWRSRFTPLPSDSFISNHIFMILLFFTLQEALLIYSIQSKRKGDYKWQIQAVSITSITFKKTKIFLALGRE